MNITISDGDKKFASLIVQQSTDISTLKMMIQLELGIPASAQTIMLNNQQLFDRQDMKQCGIRDNDFLLVKSKNMTLSDIPPHLNQNPRALMDFIKQTPSLVNELLRVNAPLAEAVLSDSLALFTGVLAEQARQAREREFAEQQQNISLHLDPLDPVAQQQIAEKIRLSNVEANMHTAMEENPESFGRVEMLYVPMVANNVPVCAFVDSGAQSTIMSVACAQRCNLMHLCDSRFAGVAKGVGSAKIIGRIHSAPLKLGSQVIACAFTVLEGQGVDFLFGLDNLRKHQVCIDLKENALKVFGESIKFLAESELPAHIRGADMELGEGPAQRQARPAPAASSTPLSSSRTQPSSAKATHSSPQARPADPPSQRPANSATAPGPRATLPAPLPNAVTVAPKNPSQTRALGSTNAIASATTETSLQALMRLGFTRQQSLTALQQCGGNADLAAALLMQL